MNEETGAVASNPDATASAVPPETANVQAIAETLRSEMPEVQPGAVEQARAEAQASATLDVNKESFNPAIHVAGPDGKGKKNAKGAWERKRGRKAGATTSTTGTQTASGSKVGTAGPSIAAPSKEQLARQSGVGAANLFLVACIMLGGEEWQPQTDPKIGLDEKVMLEGIFGDYFVATGKTDLPPGWALFAGIGMYAAKRFTMPKTQTRIQRLKVWISGKIVAWRMRKRKSTVQPYEPIDGERDPRDKRVWSGADRSTAS